MRDLACCSNRAAPSFASRMLTGEFSDPSAAIRAALNGYQGPPPRSASLAIAAAVEGLVVEMVNASWTIDATRIAAISALPRHASERLHAVPWRWPGWATGDRAVIGPAIPPAGGPKLVLGPGTGLGVAALVPCGDRFCVCPARPGTWNSVR
jgi:glucokinase